MAFVKAFDCEAGFKKDLEMLVGVAFVEAFDCEAGFKMDLEMLVGVVFAEALDCEARFPAFGKSGMILSVEVTLGPTG